MDEYYYTDSEGESEEFYHTYTRSKKPPRQRVQDDTQQQQTCHHRISPDNRRRHSVHRDHSRDVEERAPTTRSGKGSYHWDSEEVKSPHRINSSSHSRLDVMEEEFKNWGTTEYDDPHYGQEPNRRISSTSNTLPGTRRKRRTKANSLLPEDLVDILSNFRNFQASLIALYDKFHLQPNDVRDLTSHNPMTFTANRESVQLRPQVLICTDHTGTDGCHSRGTCDRFHICHKYVAGMCKDDSCLYGHKWQTGHNNDLLCQLHLQSLPRDILQELIGDVSQSRMPKYPLDICFNYNNQKCKFRNECKRLHLCFSFVINTGRCTKSTCHLNHNPKTHYCQSLLKAHGFQIEESPRDIVTALITANPKLKKSILNSKSIRTNTKRPNHHGGYGNDGGSSALNIPTSEGKPHQNAVKSKTYWYNHLKGDVAIPEICFHSVEGKCKDETTGCKRLHAMQHFHWQVNSKDKGWFNLQQSQVTCLELAYCDPAQDCINLPKLDPSILDSSTQNLFTLMGQKLWKADFETMELHSSPSTSTLKLRRLCTENKPQHALKECTYLWYFKDVNNEWIQYGHVDSTRNGNMKSNITSDDIEKHYRQNPLLPMKFQTAQFKYNLDFANMVQVNLNTDASRQLRRRPHPHLKQQQRHHQNSSPVSSTSHWSHHLKGDVAIPEICFYSVKNCCQHECSGCQRLHAKLHYHWQVRGKDNSWLNLQPNQVACLELAYCDPNKNDVNLPQTDTSKMETLNNDLVALISRDKWTANFQFMKLSNTSQRESLHLRRLCTQNVPEKYITESSYYWYFKDKNDKFILYGQYDSTRSADMISSVSSHEIEKSFHLNPNAQINFHTRAFKYILDFSTMSETNQMTHKTREVRRRPKPHLRCMGDNQNSLRSGLPSHWKTMAESEVLRIVNLSQSSTEYQNVVGLLKGQLPNVKIIWIQRIQNPQLWIAFQNKLMKAKSNASTCQLFHGTCHDLVPKICYDNFGQQIIASSLQNPYLRTTHVSRGSNAHCKIQLSFKASDAYNYCQHNTKGSRYLLVAKTVGNSTTFTNTSVTSSTLSKYFGNFFINNPSGTTYSPNGITMTDKDEVYPEYLIKLIGRISITKSC